MRYFGRHLMDSFAGRARSEGRGSGLPAASRLGGAAGLIGALLCASCGSASPASNGDNSSADGGVPWPFISQLDDFTGFCKWSSAPATAMASPDGADAGDGVHAGEGTLTVYWNKSPPPGSHEFPVGTIILKESNQADASQRVVFAMVKRQPRGTGWNTGGADGWEWWSLSDLGNCTVGRLWRGVIPPTNEPYAGAAVGDCNGCHARVISNDYVWDTALELSRF